MNLTDEQIRALIEEVRKKKRNEYRKAYDAFRAKIASECKVKALKLYADWRKTPVSIRRYFWHLMPIPANKKNVLFKFQQMYESELMNKFNRKFPNNTLSDDLHHRIQLASIDASDLADLEKKLNIKL